MGYYDITVISVSDKAKAKFVAYIQEVAGKIVKQVDIGPKNFVYPIKKQTEGYFNALVIECEPEKIRSFSNAISIDKDTLRHLIIKSDSTGSTLTYGEKLKENEAPAARGMETVKAKVIELKPAEKPVAKETKVKVVKEKKLTKKEVAENKKTLDEKLEEILKG